MSDKLRFAYADPPYYGCGKLYKKHHKEAMIWNDLQSHKELIATLCNGFDGWALSLGSNNLKDILPLCPKECRVMAWVKPFAVFKPNVNPAYSWEPVIVYGGRKYTRKDNTVRDWISTCITLKKGLTGAKPLEFCLWILAVLNYQKGDILKDMFPGTNIMAQAIKQYEDRIL